MYSGYDDDVILSAKEDLGSHEVTKYDDLSVTVTWSSGYEAPIVRGMPYATVYYDSITPVLTFSANILTVEGEDHYNVVLDNNQTWIIYVTSPIR